MALTNNETAPLPFFNEPKPASIRLWHWLTFLFFLASVTTVIFASTMFRTRDNIAMVQSLVTEKGGTITPVQARNVAHEYSDKFWMLHKYIGFGLSILVLWRIIAEVAVSKEKRLATRIRKAASIPQSEEKKHFVLVEYGYVLFYALFILMALTGLVLAFEDWQWLDPVHGAAKQIHSIVQWGLYAYMVLHIAGVIRADLTKYGGIVSRMINGK
jgi:cytochrome b561